MLAVYSATADSYKRKQSAEPFLITIQEKYKTETAFIPVLLSKFLVYKTLPLF